MDLETKINVPEDVKEWLDYKAPDTEEYSAQLKQYMFEKGCLDALAGTVDLKLLGLCAEYFVGNSFAKNVSSVVSNKAARLYPAPAPMYPPPTPKGKDNNWESITRAFGGEEALAK